MTRTHDDERWWIAGPADDESISSVICRAAALYGCRPEELWKGDFASDSASRGGMDNPSLRQTLAIGRALGAHATGIARHRQEDAPWLLSPMARGNYCRVCRSTELFSEQPVRHRRGWDRALRLVCPIHGAPLQAERDTATVAARRKGVGAEAALSQKDRELLELIHGFAETLESALYHGAIWPSGWYGSAISARNLLIKLVTNTSHAPAHLPVSGVVPPTGLRAWVHSPSHLAVPARRLTWETFRNIADPAIRRAALWIVAWVTVPGLPEHFYPGCVELSDGRLVGPESGKLLDR